MNSGIKTKAKQLSARRRFKSIMARLAVVMSGIAVFCVVYVLLAPGLTAEWPLQCELEEHVHDESCYTLVEEAPVEAAQPELICGLEETEGHQHSDDCYTAVRGALRCEDAEHEHTDDCYEWTQELTCGLEETEGHQHGDECWSVPEPTETEAQPEAQYELTCGKEEHTHTEGCYLKPEEKVTYYCGYLTEHTHKEDCYFESGELMCTIPEHIHDDSCLVEHETVALDESFTAESEDGAVILTLHVQGDVTLAKAEEAAGFSLTLRESEDMEAYDEYAGLAAENGDVLALGVLDYELTYNGEIVDLSACQVTAEVTPTEAFQQFMDDPQTLGLMMVTEETAAVDAPADETGNTEVFFTAYTQRRGTVAYAASIGANPTFTVQYYANINRVAASGAGYGLNVIDTSKNGDGTGSNMPYNGNLNLPNKSIFLDSTDKTGRHVAMNTRLTKIYQNHEFSYLNAPNLRYFNIVTKDSLDSAYKLSQIWVLKPGGNAESTDNQNNDWNVYTYNADLKFTNRQESAGDNCIYIGDGMVMRLIYDPVDRDYTNPVNFYDYDVTDGSIYKNADDAASGNNKMNTSTQAANTSYYVQVGQQGINSADNYTDHNTSYQDTSPGAKARLAFGNSLITAWSKNNGPKVGGFFINQADTQNYSKCHFGLVKADGLTSEGKLEYNDNVSAPKLFNETEDPNKPTQGKTRYDNKEYTLDFERVGDTYTLRTVHKGGTPVTGDLTAFNFVTDSWDKKSQIWTNNFWPMDSADSAGTDGHDLLFGDPNVKQNVTPNVGAGSTFNDSDDKKNHNSFFGMNFAVSFQLTKDYVGPLEYYFFGDDDMWVFLSEYNKDTKVYSNPKLICDIGGVHAAVGEYVNLWDHINQDALGEEPTTYALSFFYTERGASGSTCWMQFTLPTVVGVDLESQLEELVDAENGALWIEKTVDGIATDAGFTFKLDLFDKDGNPLLDNYQMLAETVGGLVRDETGAIVKGDIKNIIAAGGTFTLEDGGAIAIYNLPAGATYTITEQDDSRKGYATSYTVAETRIKSSVDGTPNGDAKENAEFNNVCSGAISANIMDRVSFTNTASYELPATGGPGTALLYASGAALILLALALMYKQRPRKRGRCS